MNSSRKTPRDYTPSLLICLAALFVFLNAAILRAQNPNSGATTTGQILTVHITSPADGAVFPGPSCETTVEGVVTLSSAARRNISVLYIIDVSGSTADPFAFPPLDVNGDGVVNSGDNFNGDDFNGDVLDAEIAGALALNASIQNFDEVSVGVIAYASRAASADVSPAAGFQNFISPPQADGQPNGIPDIEEMLRSLDSHITQGGSIGLFTPISRDSLGNTTNFEAALRALLAAVASRPGNEQKIAYFLSDGRNEIGGDIADEISQAAAAGIIINTVGISSNSEPALLNQIAQGTGGRFTQVDNPAELRVVLPAIPLVGIAEVRVNDQPVTLSGIGTFAINAALTPGTNVISAAAIADDQTSVTARISASCGVEPLACELQIIEPPEGLLICGDQTSVKVVSRASGGVAPIRRVCSINGVIVNSMTDTLSADVTVGADNRIVVICAYTDAENNSVVCMDSVVVRRPAPLQCALNIQIPALKSFVCDDSVTVSARVEISGGAPAFVISGEINGAPANVVGAELTARVPVVAGENIIIANASIVDSCGAATTCSDTLRFTTPLPLQCSLEVESPEDGAFVCDDSSDVSGIVNVSGGIPPFLITIEVNGVNAIVSDNRFSARVPLTTGENNLTATSTVIDSCGVTTVCRDIVRVLTSQPPQCSLEILSPEDGAVVCGDSVTVAIQPSIPTGATPPVTVSCEVNGIPVAANGEATIPLTADETLIVATCTITDGCGNTSVCRDSIRVRRPPAPVTEVNIISHKDGDVVCGDSLLVTAKHTLADGFPPFAVVCEINGVPAPLTDSLFSARVDLTAGENSIVAVCATTDSCGRAVVSRDSITVFRDDVPPTCTFKNDGLNIRGVFSDEHSGVASFAPVRLKNSKLTVDPFTPGAKSVSFLLEPIDPNKPTGFSIDIFDVCGNRFNCDPVFARLETDRARQMDFTFPPEDRYLQITNFGLTAVRVDLNGNKFQFTADLMRAQNQLNSFYLPQEGRLTIDLENYLRDDDNAIFIAYDGPAGAAADLFLLDHVHEVDFILNLQTLPTEFHLSQNYPNPFNPTTKIRFDIPQRMSEGVNVQIKIYNLLGELVRVVMDEHKFPGQHVAEWDGRNQKGETVTSGIYIYQLTAGREFRETKRMVLLK